MNSSNGNNASRAAEERQSGGTPPAGRPTAPKDNDDSHTGRATDRDSSSTRPVRISREEAEKSLPPDPDPDDPVSP